MTQKHHKQTVVVTGASAGLGRSIALTFARRKCSVALLSRDEGRLGDLKKQIEDLGGQALAVSCDVADATQVDAAAERVEIELGPIDIWVNNAMVTIFSTLDLITPEEYRRVTEVTYLSFVWGTMCALKRMKERNRGVIVQVGSALAYRAIPLQSAYCGAKHAIRGFTDSVRSELIHEKSKIHISMVQMPALNTPQFDWGRNKMGYKSQPVPPIYQPEVGAEAVYWASQHRQREVNVGARTPLIIWGNKFFPKYGDRYLARHGYDSQMTDTPLPPEYRDNLFQSVPGSFGVHGRFNDQAKDKDPYFFWRVHPGLLRFLLFLLLVLLSVLIIWGIYGLRDRGDIQIQAVTLHQ